MACAGGKYMNKKGHVATFLLFLIAVILVVASIYSFLSFRNDFQGISDNFYLGINSLEFKEKYVREIFNEAVLESARLNEGKQNFVELFNVDFMRIATEKDLRTDITGNFFAKVRNGEYELEYDGKNGVYTIVLRDVFVDSLSESSHMLKNFDLFARSSNE